MNVAAVCVYNGVNYYQGQTWDDGCDRRCRCEDAVQGIYVCNDRSVTPTARIVLKRPVLIHQDD